MADDFQTYRPGLTSPAEHCVEVTPADDADLAHVARELYVGTSGDVVVTAVGDAAPVTFKNVPASATLRVRAKRVHATGTTADDIIAMR